MTMFRSLLFNAAFYVWALFMNVLFLPGLLGSRMIIVYGQAKWAAGNVWLMRWLAGVRLEIRGRENLPDGACIVASKHQSAFDTFIVHLLLHDPAVVLKKELLSIPFYGWYTRKTEMIPVDRAGGAKALKDMVAAARRAAEQRRPIFIFPEGTRTAPGGGTSYQPGVAALYKRLDLPVIPVALNSGLFWPRRSFLRKPGTIVIEFLAPIEAGLERKAFMDMLRDRIETATRRLENDAAR